MTAPSMPFTVERVDEGLGPPGNHGGDQGSFADRRVGIDPDVIADRTYLGSNRDPFVIHADPNVRGDRDLEQPADHAALGGIVHRRDTRVAETEVTGHDRFGHDGHRLEERIGGRHHLLPHTRGQSIGEGRREQRRGLDRCPLGDDDGVPGPGHRRRHVGIRRAQRHARRSADHRPLAAVVASGVSGDDRDAELLAGRMEGLPQGRQVRVRERRGQVEVDRHPAERQAAGGGVGRQDMHREPRRSLPPVGGDDEHGVGGERHGDSPGDPNDAHVDAVLRPHQDVFIPSAQTAKDDLLEQLRRRLPRSLLGYRFTQLFAHLGLSS